MLVDNGGERRPRADPALLERRSETVTTGSTIMLRSSIRTIVTSKTTIGLASLALLGGGAALAAPGGTPAEDVLAATSTPLDELPPEVPAEPDVSVATEEAPEVETEVPEVDEVEVPEVQDAEESVELPEVDEAEDDGPNWALGNTADIDGRTQQERVEEFCAAREADGEGVPPFCTSGEDGGAEPPNARGQRIAEAARGGELGEDGDDDGAGPPPWAGRPGGPGEAPDEPSLDDASDDGVEAESAGPPAGVPAGPPAGVPGRGRN
jgi:hypothetical protein